MQSFTKGTVKIHIISRRTGNTICVGTSNVQTDAKKVIREEEKREAGERVQLTVLDNSITLRHIEGPRIDRTVVFTPASDMKAWSELVEFASDQSVRQNATV